MLMNPKAIRQSNRISALLLSLPLSLLSSNLLHHFNMKYCPIAIPSSAGMTVTIHAMGRPKVPANSRSSISSSKYWLGTTSGLVVVVVLVFIRHWSDIQLPLHSTGILPLEWVMCSVPPLPPTKRTRQYIYYMQKAFDIQVSVEMVVTHK